MADQNRLPLYAPLFCSGRPFGTMPVWRPVRIIILSIILATSGHGPGGKKQSPLLVGRYRRGCRLLHPHNVG